MQLTLTLALDVLRGRFDEGVSYMFSAMCAWVLFANLQANLSPFRCIPHYVTQRDVERNNCSLEPVGYRHFPRPYVSTRGCGYARLYTCACMYCTHAHTHTPHHTHKVPQSTYKMPQYAFNYIVALQACSHEFYIFAYFCPKFVHQIIQPVQCEYLQFILRLL